jgi:hypothetical protein
MAPLGVTFESLDSWPLAAALAVAVLVTVLDYLRQPGTAGGWLLAALRGAALLALAAAVLQPVVTLRDPAAARGRITVLLDRSASMSIVDPPRSIAEQVRLAAGLGLIPVADRRDPSEPLRSGIASLRRQLDEVTRVVGEMDYARVAGRDDGLLEMEYTAAVAIFKEQAADLADLARDAEPTAPLAMRLAELAGPAAPDLARLRDVESRLDALVAALDRITDEADVTLHEEDELVRSAVASLAGRSRIELAQQAIERLIVPALSARFDLQVQAFALADPAAGAAGLIPLASGATVVADGAGTDLRAAVEQAMRRENDDGPDAVVLLSDGREVASVGAAGSLLSLPTPLHAIAVAPSRPSPDLAIVRVDVPAVAFVGEAVPVRVEVRGSGFGNVAASVGVTLESDARTRGVALGDGQVQSIEIPLQVRAAGVARVTIELVAREGEATDRNNRVERWIKVIPQRLHVAIVSGSPRWDVQYLRSLLERTPWIRLAERSVRAGETAALPPESLASADLIVLADVAPDALDASTRRAIRARVIDDGAGLLLLAGDLDPLRRWARDDELAWALPYDAGEGVAHRVWPGEDPRFRVVPQAGGFEAGPLRLAGDADESRRRWYALPAVYRLLEFPPLKPGANVLLRELDAGVPVLVENRVGAGRVLMLGTAETWRWRSIDGGVLHDLFLLQLLRHAASEPFALWKAGVEFDVDRLVASPGEPIRARARRVPVAGVASAVSSAGLSAPLPPLRIERDGAIVREVALVSGESPEGSAIVRDLSEGTYRFSLDGDASLAIDVLVAQSDERELADVSGDADLLQRLADASGGAVYRPSQARELVAALQSLPAREPPTRTVSLWSSWYWLGLVVGCLSLEWALRKHRGMM